MVAPPRAFINPSSITNTTQASNTLCKCARYKWKIHVTRLGLNGSIKTPRLIQSSLTRAHMTKWKAATSAELKLNRLGAYQAWTVDLHAALSTQCTQCRLWIAVYQRLWGLLEELRVGIFNPSIPRNLEDGNMWRQAWGACSVPLKMPWTSVHFAWLIQPWLWWEFSESTQWEMIFIHISFIMSWTRNKHWTE